MAFDVAEESPVLTANTVAAAISEACPCRTDARPVHAAGPPRASVAARAAVLVGCQADAAAVAERGTGGASALACCGVEDLTARAALDTLATAGFLPGRTRFTLAGGDVEDLSRGAAGGDALAAAQHGTRGAHDVLALAGRCV